MYSEFWYLWQLAAALFIIALWMLRYYGGLAYLCYKMLMI